MAAQAINRVISFIAQQVAQYDAAGEDEHHKENAPAPGAKDDSAPAADSAPATPPPPATPEMVQLLNTFISSSRSGTAGLIGILTLFAIVIAYVFSPFDLLPDWLGMFGMTDDLYLVGLSLARLLRNAGPDLLLEHWDGRPKALGYMIESVEEVGSKLPASIRRVLHGTVFPKS